MEHKPAEQIHHMVDYMKKRTGGQVNFIFDDSSRSKDVKLHLLSPPLFEWVVENLIKNALDAIEGNGTISIAARTNEMN